MRKHPDPPIWPVVGPTRQFVPARPEAIRELDDFIRDEGEYRRLRALLESICNTEGEPRHEKLKKMHGRDLWEFRRFGQRGLGRLYLYRTQIAGKDTFLICMFCKKKRREVESAVESTIADIAQTYLNGRGIRR